MDSGWNIRASAQFLLYFLEANRGFFEARERGADLLRLRT